MNVFRMERELTNKNNEARLVEQKIILRVNMIRLLLMINPKAIKD